MRGLGARRGYCGELGSIAHAEFGVHVREMCLHRPSLAILQKFSISGMVWSLRTFQPNLRVVNLDAGWRPDWRDVCRAFAGRASDRMAGSRPNKLDST